MSVDDTIEFGRPSFLVRLDEVDGVIDELTRLAAECGIAAVGTRLSRELDVARSRVRSRRYARKGFRFWPSPELAGLMAAALAGARGQTLEQPILRPHRIERRFCALSRA